MWGGRCGFREPADRPTRPLAQGDARRSNYPPDSSARHTSAGLTPRGICVQGLSVVGKSARTESG